MVVVVVSGGGEWLGDFSPIGICYQLLLSLMVYLTVTNLIVLSARVSLSTQHPTVAGFLIHIFIRPHIPWTKYHVSHADLHTDKRMALAVSLSLSSTNVV